MIRSPVDVHQPVCEMLCNSKISSVTYSGYTKGLLASSDYEGTVTLWDTNTAVKTRVLQVKKGRLVSRREGGGGGLRGGCKMSLLGHAHGLYL